MTTGQLHERDAHLEALADWWGEALAGEGRLVFVAGEAGVGKTALVRRFRDQLSPGVRALAGTSEPLATPAPLGPLLDMVDVLSPVFAELMSGHHDAVAVRRAFLQELRTKRSGTFVVIEDAHWADEATLDLLRHVGRRIETVPAMAVVTYRDEEVGVRHPLRVLMGDLAALPSVKRLDVPPLSVEGVQRLVGAEGGLDVAELHRRTGGNPFFVTEVLASGADVVPTSVRDAVLARAARLGPAAREALEATACLGGRLTPAFFAEVCGEDPEALDECLARGVLVEEGGELAFRHELARAAVEQTVPARRAAAYHAKALEILRRRSDGVDPARLAEHAERAGDRAGVLEFTRAAAQRSARLGAHRESAAHFGRALAAAGELPDSERAVLLEAHARQCYMSNQFKASRRSWEEALGVWHRLGDPRREAGALLGRAFVALHHPDDIATVDVAVHEAIAILERVPAGPELVFAYALLAKQATIGFRNDQAIAWARRALALAEPMGHFETAALARIALGVGQVQNGDPEGWLVTEDVVRRAQAAGLDDIASLGLFYLVHLALGQRRYALLDRWHSEALAYVVEHDQETWRGFIDAYRAVALLDRGRWPEAESLAADVLRRSPTSPPDATRMMATVVLGRVRARRGDPDASHVLDDAWEMERPARDLTAWLGRSVTALAEWAWYRGEREQVPGLLARTYEGAVQLGEPWWLGEVAYWMWRSDHLVEPPSGMAEPYALQLTGQWREAMEAWQDLERPYEAALAMVDSGQVQPLRDALDVFDRLGARPARDEAARRLRRLGVTDIPRSTRGRADAGDVLSPRENEVLGLLAEGLRNSEIAEKLFLSERTVEHHVAAVLRKLGVSRRADAARLVLRDGLTGVVAGRPPG